MLYATLQADILGLRVVSGTVGDDKPPVPTHRNSHRQILDTLNKTFGVLA